MTKNIGRYQVQAELGRGGFGRVFRAFDPTVGRLVAIKTLNTSDEPDMLTRFRSEAAATGKLHHPNIVVIYDFGEHDGSPFLVMELLDGEDLERILTKRGTLTLLRTLDVMLQAASGLHHAHSKGVVHRDIKPANIMLLADGHVKIMDFGIALVTQATAARITPHGSTIGTLPYMAPEQFAGSISDVLSDVFAFGITFYRVLTGTHPFHAPDMGGLMYNIMKKAPVPVRSLRPDFPEALESLIGRLLAKDRDERYQSLEDMHFDLESIVLSLRKESVGQLFVEAHGLIAADEVEKAQSVVRQVMEIDPANRTARELRERLQRQIKERSVRPRVNALLEAGRQQMSTRHFDSAIEKFESALRLDESNPELRTLIGHARSAFERARRADGLFEVAREAFGRQDLTSAHLNLTEALSADPQHDQAQALLDAVQVRMDSRRREQRLRDGVSQMKKLILLQSFDEAIQAGTALAEEFPESQEAAKLLDRARQELEAQRRQERLLAGTDAVKEILRNHQFAEAAQRIAQLQQEFPDSPELRNLAAYADEELRTEKQAKLVARATEDSQQLVAQGEFDTAIDRLKRVLIEYPGLTALQDLVQRVASQKVEYQRKIAMIEALRQGEALTSQGRFVEAIEQIGAFVHAYGDSAALDPVREEAEKGLENHRRTTGIRKLVSEIQELMDAGKAREAAEILQQGTMQFPGDPQLTGLLAIAKTADQKENETAAEEIADQPSEREEPEQADSAAIPQPAPGTVSGSQGRRRILVVAGCAGAAAVLASVTFLPHRSSTRPPAEPPAVVRTVPEPPAPRLPNPEPPRTEAPSTGTLVVRAGIPDAIVYIDGEARGHTDQAGSVRLDLGLKSHRVRVERNGYRKAAEQTVNLTAGSPGLAVFSLTPDVARLQLRGAPRGVEVRAGGKLLGRTDGSAAFVFPAPLPPGDITLEVAGGAVNRSLQRRFEPGQTLQIEWKELMPAPPAANVDVSEQQDWERARNSSDVSRARDYLRNHPNSAHAKEMELHIADLTWNAVDQANVESVGRFIRENPGNSHSAEAQKIVDQYNAQQQATQERARLEQAKQERIKQDLQNQAQNKPAQSNPVPNTPSPNNPAPRAQNDNRKQRVINTLAQFDAALQHRRARDLKAIWPLASKLFLESLQNSQVRMSLTPRADEIQFPAGPDRAQAQCDLTTVIQGAIKHQKATLTLANTGNIWVVESLNFD